MNYPEWLMIETTSVCNLKCVMCTHSSDNFGRPKTHLSEKYFDQLVKYVENAKSIQLHGIGEPTLSPIFWRFLNHLSDECWSSINTNLVNINDDQLYNLVTSKLRYITISIDSPVNDSYYKIRGADLNVVINNIKRLIDFKTKFNSNLAISLNMTIMKENVTQLKEAIDLCSNIGVPILDTWPLNNWTGEYLNRDIRGFEFVYEEQIPVTFKEMYNEKVSEALEYSKEKNVKFTYYLI
jgi:MoaA/NifB/PqqE/SkfB family radical SAM enzyme